MTALAVMAAPDAADPYSRNRPLAQMTAFPAKLRSACRATAVDLLGDKAAEKAYATR